LDCVGRIHGHKLTRLAAEGINSGSGVDALNW